MRVRVLGSAAGGGFPQWNCRCGTCEAARAGVRARPRTQSSLAIRGDDGPWFLVNASPDLRQQLETLDARARRRRPRVADRRRAADRRGDRPHGGAAAAARVGDAGARLRRRGRRARADGRVSRAARCWSATAAPNGRRSNRGARSRSTARASRSSRSRRRRRAALSRGRRARGERVRLPRPRDRRRRHLRPRARQTGRRRARPASPPATSCSWTGRSGATTSSRGWASRTAARATWATCRSRAPAGRSRRSPRLERPRKVLVHINNTNPILLEDSPEREQVVRAGVEVAYDGLEVEL